MLDDLRKQEGYELMGAAFEVYNELGGGLSEEIYQESLETELRLRGLSFEAKRGLEVFYKGIRRSKTYISDLVVCDGIIAELKSSKCLAPEHEAQLLNYMRITRTRVGYLINFGPLDRLEWKRMVIDIVSKRDSERDGQRPRSL